MLKTGFSLIELMVVIAIIAIMSAIALPIYYNYTCHAQAQESLGALGTTKSSWAALRSTGRFDEPENDFSTSVEMQRLLSIELPQRNWSYIATDVAANEVIVHVLAKGPSLKQCLTAPALEYDFIVRYSSGSATGVKTGVTFHIENSTDERFIKNKNVGP